MFSFKIVFLLLSSIVLIILIPFFIFLISSYFTNSLMSVFKQVRK